MCTPSSIYYLIRPHPPPPSPPAPDESAAVIEKLRPEIPVGKKKKQGKKRTKPTWEPQIQLLVDGGCVSLQSFAAWPSVGARQSSVVATAFPRGASWGGASSEQLQFFSLLGLSVSSTSRPKAAGLGASLSPFTHTRTQGWWKWREWVLRCKPVAGGCVGTEDDREEGRWWLFPGFGK